jgi:hypothetical protein
VLNVEHERLDGCAAAPHARTAGAERPHDTQRAEAEAEADEEEKAEDEEGEDEDEGMLAEAAWLRDGSKDVQCQIKCGAGGRFYYNSSREHAVAANHERPRPWFLSLSS